ncbi:MAG: hypothetical protein RLZZ502_718 [Pseudomonadota bacterium]
MSKGLLLCLMLWLNAIASLTHAAISLGEAQVQSYLGQTLKVRIPITGLDTVEGWQEPRCFQLGIPRNESELPLVLAARYNVTTNPPALHILSSRKVDEPIVQLSVTVDCGAKFQRDYVLLIDPYIEKNEKNSGAVSPLAAAPSPLSIAPAGSSKTPAESVAEAKTTVLPASNSVPVQAGRIDADTSPRGSRNASRNGSRSGTRSIADSPMGSGSNGKPEYANTSRTAPLHAPVSARKKTPAQGALRLSDGMQLNQAERVVLDSPALKISSELYARGGGHKGTSQGGQTSPNDVGSAPASSSNAVAQARLDMLRQRLRTADVERDLDQGLETELLVTQKRLEELQTRLSLINNSSGTNDVSARAALQPPASLSTGLKMGSGQVQPDTERMTAKEPAKWWRIALDWVWLPLLLLGTLAISWALLQKWSRPPPEAQAEFESAIDLPPQAGGVELEPLNTHGANPATVGGFVNTGRMSEKTIMRNLSEGMTAGQASTQQKSQQSNTSSATGTAASAKDLDLSMDFHPKGSLEFMGVEIATITEEASVYLELGRKQEAIDILHDHIELEHAYDKATPAPWLMLIDLYFQTKQEAAYEEYRQLFMQKFNGQIPAYSDYDSEAASRPLLDYPHVVERIQQVWGQMQCNELLATLMEDDRKGNRLGFSLAAYRDLILLAGVHNSLMGVKVQPTSAPIPQTKMNLDDLHYEGEENQTIFGGPATLSSLKPRSI